LTFLYYVRFVETITPSQQLSLLQRYTQVSLKPSAIIHWWF